MVRTAFDGFTIGDFGRLSGFRAKFGFRSIQNNVQVHFAQCRKSRFAWFRRRAEYDGGIFFSQAVNGGRHFLVIALGFRFDGHDDLRFRESGGASLIGYARSQKVSEVTVTDNLEDATISPATAFPMD